MKRIEAIIRSFKVEAVKERLIQAGARGISVSEVLGYGRAAVDSLADLQSSQGDGYTRNARIQVVVDEEMVHPIVDAILGSASTGDPGDGEIFVSPVSCVYRIGTGERELAAI
jgi:nitrogen regulatory protein P-II 1